VRTACVTVRGEAIPAFERFVLEIYVDADGCPVKDEVYRVAERYGDSR
jgi:hypothetical protein